MSLVGQAHLVYSSKSIVSNVEEGGLLVTPRSRANVKMMGGGSLVVVCFLL